MKGQKASPRFLGGAAVAAAYAAWGTLTIFWNLLADVNPVYILAQRLIWSMVFMGIYMAVTGKLKDIAPAFKDKRTFLLCLACGALVTVNWGVYIYAVNSSHVLDASLGYFIEPVIVALIGMTAFKEKPSKYEKITFILAAAGLIYMVAASRTFPTLALLIAGSFSVYGAVKKKLTLTPHASLFAETLLMTPLAIGFVIYATVRMPGCTGSLSGAQFLLLPACGAGPHTIFGEERLLLLDREAVYGLRVTVQRVLFEDGMLWRRLPEQALCPAANAAWPCCSCGMPNPPDAEVCALCGRELPRAASPVESAADAQPDDQPLPARAADDEAGAEPRFGAPSVPLMTERPAPIVRERPERIVRDGFPSFDVSEEEEPDASPRWLVVLTILICTAAVLVAAGVLLYYLRDRLPM